MRSKKKSFKWIKKRSNKKKFSTIGLAFKNDYGLLSCRVCLIAAEFNQTSTCWCFISSRCMVCVGDIMSATIATVWQCRCRQHKSTFFYDDRLLAVIISNCTWLITPSLFYSIITPFHFPIWFTAIHWRCNFVNQNKVVYENKCNVIHWPGQYSHWNAKWNGYKKAVKRIKNARKKTCDNLAEISRTNATMAYFFRELSINWFN